jgi:hypothetical protein
MHMHSHTCTRAPIHTHAHAHATANTRTHTPPYTPHKPHTPHSPHTPHTTPPHQTAQHNTTQHTIYNTHHTTHNTQHNTQHNTHNTHTGAPPPPVAMAGWRRVGRGQEAYGSGPGSVCVGWLRRGLCLCRFRRCHFGRNLFPSLVALLLFVGNWRTTGHFRTTNAPW